ncbi:hypothetical protein QBC37DRAFT_6647 [Rhypophila decipiens]|uniref:Uncharacterized protein n=1 Tax=Rhypophila decipiens TaxID=261697 RepID=A0AAN6YGG4_9PEZI|nr:hypothetical protein QBC37DRAFT_6647 [Rhypophila decipiens]
MSTQTSGELSKLVAYLFLISICPISTAILGTLSMSTDSHAAHACSYEAPPTTRHAEKRTLTGEREQKFRRCAMLKAKQGRHIAILEEQGIYQAELDRVQEPRIG